MVKQAEQDFKVQFFDRQTLAFIIREKLQLLPLAQLKYAAENGFIDGDTLYFNNLVATKAQLESGWIIPLRDSWLAKKISPAVTSNK